jgi:spore maturation protein CgeB
VIDHYIRLGAQNCHPIYNALDPEHHYTVAPQPELACDLVFVGNRLPDREKRVEEFFLRVASLAPEMSFILGGEGWGSKWLPSNVRWIGHVGTGLHNAVNCSARMVLNVNRESMASVGFSPPTRVFEAAGAGACLITDEWTGVETFFEPEREILVASSAQDVIAHLRTHSAAQSKLIGTNMRDRALRDHTYAQRGLEVQQILAVVTAEVAA